MKEELLIKLNFGRHKLFSVPDGYFQQFESEMSARIPFSHVVLKPSVKRHWFVRPAMLAACIAVIAVFTLVFLFSSKIGTGTICKTVDIYQDDISSASYSDYLMDEMSDYAMLDNDDFYSIIANE